MTAIRPTKPPADKTGKPDEKMLKPREVAAILQVSICSIYRMIDRREIPFYRFTHKLRFRASDVEKYVERCRVESLRDPRSLG